MTIPRFLTALFIAFLIQVGVFAWYQDDLLYFRQPVSAITRDDARQFASHAMGALARPGLTRRHLDTIAEAARSFRQTSLEVDALTRRLAMDPTDVAVTLRLADAQRRAANFARAEALYRGVLGNAQDKIK